MLNRRKRLIKNMNTQRDTMDPTQMCRICAVPVDDETASHLLISNNDVTELGKKFISCLGIQLIKEGYPDRVCDYCQLQLNTFHAFVRKAKNTSTQFETMLRQLNRCDADAQEQSEFDGEQEQQEKPTSTVLVSADDMEYEMEETQDDESNEMEFVVNKNEVELIIDGGLEVVDIDENEIEDEYTIEYLDPEYMNQFDDEDAQNDGDQKSGGQRKKSVKSKSSNGPRVRRTYPFKCKECNKRFVYQEVYDAHIRIHKGLPGFSCPHCPKTFSEKANYDYHMQDHTNYRPAKCHLCEKSFKNKQDLASHIRCHEDVRKYECDQCKKRFRSQSHMTYHRYSHFEERNFACDKCPQKFKSPHILRTHRNTVHSTVFKYECDTCGRKFKRDHHLVAHRKTHNKMPGSRKQRKNPSEKSQKSDKDAPHSYEMIALIKDEELDLNYEDDAYEEEFITD